MKQLDLGEYLVPRSLEEALAILGEYSGSIGVIAGGSDVFVEEHPELDAMLDITKTGLDFIEKRGNSLHIGSCATFRDLFKSGVVREHFASLWEVSCTIADLTIRNIATVGGNICSAVPSGDAIPPMLAADAVFVLASRTGEREVRACDFFVGPRRSVMEKNELLRELRVPLKGGRRASAFEKIARNSVDLANANVAVSLSCSDGGLVETLGIALGAVAPTVVRVGGAEAHLVGKKPTDELLEKACAEIPSAISPITNIRSTKEYRTEVLRSLTKKAVERAYRAAMA